MGIRGENRRVLGNGLLWPDSVRVTPTEIQLGARWVRTFWVAGFPRRVYPGWLQPLLEFPWPLALAFYSGPVSNQEALRQMNHRLTWQRGSQVANALLGRLSDPEQETAVEDAERLRRELGRGDTKMLDVALYLGLWANSLEELNEITDLLEGLTKSLMMVIRLLRYQQTEGLQMVLPLGRMTTTMREMDSAAWGTLFPLASQDLLHVHGQVWGTNASNQSLVILDRFQYPSPHSVTIGWSGAGKSYGAKLEAIRARYRGLKVAVIDPEGEYRVLAQAGAKIVCLGSESPSLQFDPFDLERLGTDAFDAKIDFLGRFLSRLVEDWGKERQAGFIRAVWRMRQLHPGDSMFSPEGARFDQILFQLRQEQPESYELVALAREKWHQLAGQGGGALLTSGPSDFVVYDLSRVTPKFKGACYLALAEMLAQETWVHQQRLVIFDEAWHLLNDSETATYLEELFRRARKWGTAISLITQDFGDLVRNQAAAVCLRNAPIILLLHQHPESLNEIGRELHLHAGELDRVSSAPVGEGLLIAGEDHLALRIWAAPMEKTLLSQAWDEGNGAVG